MTEMSERVTDLVFPHPVHLCPAPSSTAARGREEIAGLLSGVVVGLAQRGGGAVTANLVVDGVKKVGFLRALLPTLYPLKEREREGREHYQHSSHFFPPPLLSGAERGFGLLLCVTTAQRPRRGTRADGDKGGEGSPGTERKILERAS